ERIGVERAKKALEQADVALLLVDASAEPTAEEQALLRLALPCPCAVLLNKQDAGEKLSVAEVRQMSTHAAVFRISAQTLEGLDEVRQYLSGFVRMPQENMLTHERHLSVAREALGRLNQALATLTSKQPLDLAAVDMHEALYLLGSITGDSVDEKLLDDIFSRFCVGK
ncbi:MAG: hypothetical protein RR824_05445, partial [Clostridia bacterium]